MTVKFFKPIRESFPYGGSGSFMAIFKRQGEINATTHKKNYYSIAENICH